MNLAKKRLLEMRFDRTFSSSDELNKFINDHIKTYKLVNINPLFDKILDYTAYSIYNGYIVLHTKNSVSYCSKDYVNYDLNFRKQISELIKRLPEIRISNTQLNEYKTLNDKWVTEDMEIFRYVKSGLI